MWIQKAHDFNKCIRSRAYDIKITDMAYQWKLEESFGVKMTAEDKAFYYDNCYGSYSAICTSTVSPKWYKEAK